MWRKMTNGIYFATFFILFAILFKQAEGTDNTANEINKKNPFDKKGTDILFGNDKHFNEDDKFSSFGSPALFNVGDEIVAMAEAHFKNKTHECGSIMATVMNKNKEWGKVSAFLRDCSEEKNLKFLLNPTATVIKDEEVSVILAGYSREDNLKNKINANDLSWEPLITSGSVVNDGNNHGDTQGAKHFKWKEEIQSLRDYFKHKNIEFKDIFKKNRFFLKHFVSSGGVGIKAGDKYMLPMQGVTEETNISFTMAFSDSKNELEFLSKDDGIKNCSYPAIIQWNKEDTFMITPCGKGHYTICKYSTGKEDWDCSKETLSGMWGNNKERTGYGVRAGFTNAMIEKRNVAFFTQPIQEENNNCNKLHLWITDMTHTYDLGQISDDSENVMASSLLYRKNKNNGIENKKDDQLYCLYEVKNTDGKDIVFIDLTKKLKKINEVINKWNKVDEKVFNFLCSYTNKKSFSSIFQRGIIPTEFLVSYFSNTLIENNEWKDEYLHMNATITGETKETADKNGFHFSKVGAGAKWLVNTDKQNNPYYFANYEFTFIATITIYQTVIEKKMPLLGVVLIDKSGKEQRVVLLCTKGKKWSVSYGEEKDEEEYEEEIEGYESCKTGVPYQITMSFYYEDFILYINGKSFESYLEDKVAEFFEDKKYISYIYFGADKEKINIDASISNVFIYSRAIDGGSNELKSIEKFCENTPLVVSADKQQGLEHGNQKKQNEMSKPDVVVSEESKNKNNEVEGLAEEEPSLNISPTPSPEQPPQQLKTTPPLAEQPKPTEITQEQQPQQTSAPEFKKKPKISTDEKEQKENLQKKTLEEKQSKLPAEISLQNKHTNNTQNFPSQNDISQNNFQTEVEEEQINIDEKEEDNLKEDLDDKNTSSEFPSVQNLTVLNNETTNQSDKINVNSSKNSDLNHTQLNEQAESTQLPAPTTQNNINTTLTNISDIFAMIPITNSSGDGTVRVCMSLVLLLTGLLSFVVIFY